MLIQNFVGAAGAPRVQNALGFGSAKPCPVGVGLFRRLCSLDALLKSLQVDYIPHGCLHHAINWERAKSLQMREWSRVAGSIVIYEIPVIVL
jgi:hypothetical protein